MSQGVDSLTAVALEHHAIFRLAEMIFGDRCSSSHDLASLSLGRRDTFDTWTGKTKLRWDEAVSIALNFQSLKEVSQY